MCFCRLAKLATAKLWPMSELDREAVMAVHTRYLVEVVEELGLCPFARRCRQQGRLERPLIEMPEGPPEPDAVAETLAAVETTNPAVEIVLLTFVAPRKNPTFTTPAVFDAWVRELRTAYEKVQQHQSSLRYYMVGFHPKNRQDPKRELTRDSLVPLLRRTPDPVIQCIRADLLDDLRRQAQEVAQAKFREEVAKLAPELQTMLAHAVSTDSELSSEIADNNFARVGCGEGLADLELRIGEILQARDALGCPFGHRAQRPDVVGPTPAQEGFARPKKVEEKPG